MFRTSWYPVFAVSGLLLWAPSAFAQKWDAFPELKPNQRVGIQKVNDGPRFDPLRACMSQDSLVGARYFVSMVGITASSGSANRKDDDATEFATAQASAWQLNPKTDVLFAVGLKNRSFGIVVGSDWTAIGMDGPTLERTKEASHFPKAIRRRDYNQALCSLASAIDHTLFEVKRTRAEQTKEVDEKSPEVAARLKAFRERVAAEAVSTEFGTGLETRLATLDTQVKEAAQKLETAPSESLELLKKSDQELVHLTRELDEYTAQIKVLDEAVAELEALKKSIDERPDSSWEDVQNAVKTLKTCDEKVASIRNSLDGHPQDVRACMAVAEAELAKGELRHLYLARYVPAWIALLLLTLGLIGAGLVALSRRRVGMYLAPELLAWEHQLERAEGWLNQLRTDYPEFFAAQSAQWQGSSEALGKESSDAINLAYFLLHQGLERLADARRLSRAKTLELRSVDKAMRVLRDDKFAIEQGQIAPGSPLQSGMIRAYHGNVSNLPGDLSNALLRAQQLLQESAEWMRLGARHTTHGHEALVRAHNALQARQQMGFAANHIVAPLKTAQNAYQNLTAQLHTDPSVAVSGAFERVITEIEAQVASTEAGNAAAHRLTSELADQKQTVATLLSKLNAEGFQLKESGFDATSEFAELNANAAQAKHLLEAGQDQAATRTIEIYASGLSDLESKLRAVEVAPALIPEMVQRLEQLREDIKSDLLTLRMHARSEEEALNELVQLQGHALRSSAELSTIQRLAADQKFLGAFARLKSVVEVFDRAIEVIRKLESVSGTQTRTASAAPWPKAWAHVK